MPRSSGGIDKPRAVRAVTRVCDASANTVAIPHRLVTKGDALFGERRGVERA